MEGVGEGEPKLNVHVDNSDAVFRSVYTNIDFHVVRCRVNKLKLIVTVCRMVSCGKERHEKSLFT
jgi:hypothetical protein